jgi:hypothetical protein
VLLVGTRAGYADGLENRLGPRAGLELWASPPPARLPLGLPLGVGLALSMGDVTAPASAAGGGWRGSLLPLALRLAWEQRVGSSFVGRAGAAAVAAWLRARTDAGSASGFGLGYGAFASAALAMRRGELLAELSYGRTPVPTPLGRVEASGLCLELGLRVGVF